MGGIKTVYIPKGNEEAWRVFEEIAKREKGDRGVSQLLNELVLDYTKKHANGNNQFTLEVAGGLGFSALPTIGEVMTPERVDQYDEDTLLEIVRKSKARGEEALAGLKRKGYDSWTLERMK
jgi:hypothetical protein